MAVIKKALLFFLIHAAVVYGLTYRIQTRMNATSAKLAPFSFHLQRMDSLNYKGIAQYGYQFPGLSGVQRPGGRGAVDEVFYKFHPETNNVAFFPLYPYLARILYTIGFSIDWSLTLVSLAFCFLFWLAWFSKTFETVFGKSAQNWGGVVFLFFPTSFYLFTAYSESVVLFLTLMVLKSWIEEIDTGKPLWKTSLSLCLLGLAKITALPLVLAVFAFTFYRRQDVKTLRTPLALMKFWVPQGVLACSGVFLFFAYCAVRFHEPLLYIQLQKYSWPQGNAGLMNILKIDNIVGTLFKNGTSANGLFGVFPTWFAFLALARPQLQWKLVGLMILPVMFTVYSSMASQYMIGCIRYALMAVPVFFYLGHGFSQIPSRPIRWFLAAFLVYAEFFWMRAWLWHFLKGEFLA